VKGKDSRLDRSDGRKIGKRERGGVGASCSLCWWRGGGKETMGVPEEGKKRCSSDWKEKEKKKGGKNAIDVTGKEEGSITSYPVCVFAWARRKGEEKKKKKKRVNVQSFEKKKGRGQRLSTTI